MVGGGNDNNRLGFNGKWNQLIYSFKTTASSGWMSFFIWNGSSGSGMIQNGLRPVDGWIYSEWTASSASSSSFLPFVSPALPSLPFPQSVLSRSGLLLQRSVAHSGASVRCSSWFQLRYHQPPIVAARSVSIHHSKISWTHIAEETNIFVSCFPVASFPVTFVVWRSFACMCTE